MTEWPVVDREPVELPRYPDQSRQLWETLVELTEVRPGEWTLVGGQMVSSTRRNRQRARLVFLPTLMSS